MYAASFTTEIPEPSFPNTGIPPHEEPETSTHTMVLDNSRGNAPLDTWTSDIYSGTRNELEAILLYWRDAKGALMLHYTR